MVNFSLSNKILFFLILLSTLSASAQKEAANWYFGRNAGVDFNTAPVSVLQDGQINQTEGSAAISDSNGNLLFYTDGSRIYNANHVTMQNGTSLAGTYSTTQALITPQPNNPNRYYLFVIDGQNGLYISGPSPGLAYSVIDMTLDGGLGGVLPGEKNIILETPNTEKVTATYHGNGQDLWVVSHRINNNEFTSYKLTANGLNTTPVVSSVGEVHTATSGDNFAGVAGCLKFSPNGKKIACGKTFENTGLELFDFDNSTGVVSNARKLNNDQVYGVEFSPNSKILYCSQSHNSNVETLKQYNISKPDLQGVINSETVLSAQNKNLWNLQLGINGKLYVSYTDPNSRTLYVVNNPNTAGVGCNLIPDAVDVAPKDTWQGLPSFIQDYFQFEIDYQSLCFGAETAFEVLRYGDLVSANWDFGEPSSGGDNTSTELDPTHTYSSPGDYIVNVEIETPTGAQIQLTDSLSISSEDGGLDISEPSDLGICNEDGTEGVFSLSGQIEEILNDLDPEAFTVNFYTSETDAQNDANPIQNPGNYTNTENPQSIYVRVETDDEICSGFTQFNLQVVAEALAPDVPNLTACIENSSNTSFDLTQQNAALLNGQPGAELSYFTTETKAQNNTDAIQQPEAYTVAEYPQEIFVRVFYPASTDCFSINSFSLQTSQAPPIPVDFEISGCSVLDLTQLAGDLPDSLTLSYYRSQTDAREALNAIENPQEFQFSGQSLYLRAENDQGCATIAEITVKKVDCFIPEGISPNGDGLNDSFDISELTSAYNGGNIKIFNRYGSLVYKKNAYANEWNGHDMNGNKLPTGTYYYVLKLNEPSPEYGQVIKRWVYLQRPK